MIQRLPRLTLICACAALLAACAAPGKLPEAELTVSAAKQALPAQWQASLPHQGSTAKLADFWAAYQDPLLLELMLAAQQDNPTLASAQARLSASRAARVASSSALLPGVNASASAQRGVQGIGQPPASGAQIGAQLAWEIDLFGGNAAAQRAAELRLQSAEANWHDARVLVAADTALQYMNYRFCQAQLAIGQSDATSRSETARLSKLTADAGLLAPATLALSEASAAEAAQRVHQVQGECGVIVKGLVAITSIAEPQLLQKLTASNAKIPDFAATSAMFGIDSVPAQVLAQRPDVSSAERDVLAAAADVKATDSAALPRISLQGSLAAGRAQSAGFTQNGTLWSLGPISISLPLFDGGRNAASSDAARARYDEAAALYRARLRQAVREVEEALLGLQTTASRVTYLQTAAAGYLTARVAADAKYRAGIGSLLELEDARRITLAADLALLSLQRERIIAWIALYRAAGGGLSIESLGLPKQLSQLPDHSESAHG